MRRRQFIALFGAAAALSVTAARTQQASRPVIGFLGSRSPEDSAKVLDIFRKALDPSGDGSQSPTIEYRWAQGQYDRLPAMAAELISAKVAVIGAFGPPAALAAKNATATTPVVFVTGGDPVAMGLVNSLSRPGGNITGVNLVNSELGSKRLDVLVELLPSAKLIAFLENPKNPDSSIETGDALAAARSLGRQGFIANASTDQEIEEAFATIVRRQAGALLVGVDPFFNARRSKIVSLAAQYRIPAIYQFREFADAGGLISYGASLADAYRQAASYVGRILAGTRPADLPILQSVKFELVLNLKTAKALGLAVPPSLLARADEVIE